MAAASSVKTFEQTREYEFIMTLSSCILPHTATLSLTCYGQNIC